MFFDRHAIAIALVLALILSGCSQSPPEQTSESLGDANRYAGAQNTVQPDQPAARNRQPENPMASESATKIYIGMRQTGLKEAVVDVQSNEVVIGFKEDTTLNNEALVYRAFGLSANFEPRKVKTTVLIFLSDNKMIEVSAYQNDILALLQGDMNNAEFKEKVSWLQ
ncbi:MAG TPA: hypothetical protein VFF13_02510 [archaeon]|nr:hypothetical protein [archaeon]